MPGNDRAEREAGATRITNIRGSAVLKQKKTFFANSLDEYFDREAMRCDHGYYMFIMCCKSAKRKATVEWPLQIFTAGCVFGARGSQRQQRLEYAAEYG